MRYPTPFRWKSATKPRPGPIVIFLRNQEPISVVFLTTVVEDHIRAGTVFTMEPNCAIGRRVVDPGGTVVVGESGGIELNTNATKLMHTQ